MKIIQISEKSVRLTVENENNKIANKLRTVFFDNGCVPLSQLDEYEEVPYEIWCNFLPDLVPKTKVEELEQQLSCLQEEKDYLETILLNTDFRLTCMELKGQGLLD